MSSFTEDELVEQPAIQLFQKELNYTYLNCFNEEMGLGSKLGRENRSIVVLNKKLRESLLKLNPTTPTQTINDAIKEINKDRSVLKLEKANIEIHKMLKDGLAIQGEDENRKPKTYNIKIIDFENIDNNDFFLASQFWITGDVYTRRSDLIGFINGLPLIFIELKTTHRNLKDAFDHNLSDYKDTIPQIFWYNAFIILSNGSESKIGTISSEWDYFNEWKKISNEEEEGLVSLETIIRGTCEKQRFLDILENFIIFQDIGGSLKKFIAKNHQYLGVNNTIKAYLEVKRDTDDRLKQEDKHGKIGVFWHTQGSGKSISMIFFAQKILRKYPGSPTFVVITDEQDLDNQIYKKFLSLGAVIEPDTQAKNCEHLEQLLKENHRYVFTIIHKFQKIDKETKERKPYPKLTDRTDIIIIADEAHRTQYDELAKNMRIALPHASFIAFTGTPLIKGEDNTRETFGDYVSIYNFKQSMDDGATVPLYYENRLPEVNITKKDFDEKFVEILEEEIDDELKRRKIQRNFPKIYHVLTRDDRLEKIASDIVNHYMNRGYLGKAMVVSIDKLTTVKMYEKVQKHWKNYLKNLKDNYTKASLEEEKRVLNDKIIEMEQTDMAVVISEEQGEVKKFAEHGLNIKIHRKRIKLEDLKEKFQDPENPFRIAFVCSKWITGFDAPSVSTMYIDKPLKNHALMQLIARANRVFGEEKENGLIVDYFDIFTNMKKALAIYAAGKDEEDTPIKPKKELMKLLRQAVSDITKFLEKKNIDIYQIINAQKFTKIKLIKDATNEILVNEQSKNEFMKLAAKTKRLYKAILPDKEANEFTSRVVLFKVLRDRIRSLEPKGDITEAMDRINDLLDQSISAEGYRIKGEEDTDEVRILDLSKIDFEGLRKQFKKGRKYSLVESMKNGIYDKLVLLVMYNKTRLELLEKFKEMVENYNNGTIDIDIFFEQLVTFTKELDEEEKRTISENLSEEELAIFDLLLKKEITRKEREIIKLASMELLKTLKVEKLVLDWRKKQQTRAGVRLAIEEILDNRLPESYSINLFNIKCNLIYQHIFDSYFGAGQSIYSSVKET